MSEIRTLIERWAAAVHAGDLPTVLADHTDDIVMFDVPPPEQGVRGLDAYRETWPGFFEWQAKGAVFEIESLEITEGTDVAFAVALLRCGTPEELADEPDRRLRLTLGLRKENDRWVVAHEHHSFTQPSESPDEIRDVHQQLFDASARKDIDDVMAHIGTDVVNYEHEAPLLYTGKAAVRAVCKHGLDRAGFVKWDVPDLTVVVRGDLAVAWGLNHMQAEGHDTWSRGTRVFRKRLGRWVMVHQHASFPFHPDTGAAATDLQPG